MPTGGPFPLIDAQLDTYFKRTVPYLAGNAGRLMIPAERVADLTSRLEAWDIAYPLSKASLTRTQSAIDNKKAAKASLLASLRHAYADIPRSVLSPEDLNTLDLKLRGKPTRVHRPATHPTGRGRYLGPAAPQGIFYGCRQYHF